MSSRPDVTEDTTVDGQRCVLIVDPSAESREVLETALERRGLRTLSAGRVQKGMELARQHRPDLIVLDLEAHCAAGDGVIPLAEQSQRDGEQVVFLGSARRLRDRFPAGEFMAKPYHYATLIRRIEELLDAAR